MSKGARRRLLYLLPGALLAVALAIRIFLVNSSALLPPIERHSIGEEVSPDGTFYEDAYSENPDGYVVKVKSAQIMTRDDYVRLHGVKGDARLGGDEGLASVLCLDLVVRNTSSTEGGIWVLDFLPVLPDRTAYLNLDSKLWSLSEDSLGESATSFSIKRDSEYEVHVPFTLGSTDEDRYSHELPAGSYEVLLSNLPVQKVVLCEADYMKHT